MHETIGAGGLEISARMHLRGQILTKLVQSIVTHGLSVCDGAHVSDDGTKERKHGTRKQKSSGASASCETGGRSM